MNEAATEPPQQVRIDERLIGRIGVREWGLPSICMPGKMWRSEKHGTITCITPKNKDHVNIETLPLVVIPAGEMSQMPDSWRASLWIYVQEWFHSGCGYGPFLAITDEQRCDMIRKVAKELVASDNIGCSLIANSIGEFAAHGYELPKVAPQPCPHCGKFHLTSRATIQKPYGHTPGQPSLGGKSYPEQSKAAPVRIP